MSYYVLWPRRGGGITIGGGSSYDSQAYLTTQEELANPLFALFNSNEIAAMRALIASGSILILAALIAAVMVGLKSWLSIDGKRKKTRLIMFSFLLAVLIAVKGVSIADLAERLQNPSGFGRILYFYDSDNFTARHITIGLLSLVADILLYSLILVEVTRSNGNKKQTLVETANIIYISVFGGIGLASWSYDTAFTMRNYYENYRFNNPWPVLSGLSTTYATLALIFAIEMLALSVTKSLPKGQGVLLQVLTIILSLGQILSLANICVQYFNYNSNSFTAALGLSATIDFIWAAKVILLALLAWASYKSTGADNKVGPKASHNSSVSSALP